MYQNAIRVALATLFLFSSVASAEKLQFNNVTRARVCYEIGKQSDTFAKIARVNDEAGFPEHTLSTFYFIESLAGNNKGSGKYFGNFQFGKWEWEFFCKNGIRGNIDDELACLPKFLKTYAKLSRLNVESVADWYILHQQGWLGARRLLFMLQNKSGKIKRRNLISNLISDYQEIAKTLDDYQLAVFYAEITYFSVLRVRDYVESCSE